MGAGVPWFQSRVQSEPPDHAPRAAGRPRRTQASPRSTRETEHRAVRRREWLVYRGAQKTALRPSRPSRSRVAPSGSPPARSRPLRSRLPHRAPAGRPCCAPVSSQGPRRESSMPRSRSFVSWDRPRASVSGVDIIAPGKSKAKAVGNRTRRRRAVPRFTDVSWDVRRKTRGVERSPLRRSDVR